METGDWGTTSTFSRPATTKHNSKANIAARSLDASFFRPSFSRPSETTLQGDLRLKPIRVRAVQRSRMKEPQDIAREQLEKLEKKVSKMRGSGTLKAEASFMHKKLQATLSKNTATEERVIALKRTMKTFLKNQGAESERELKCAFHRADIDQSGELDYDEFRDAVKNYGIKTLTAGSLKTLFDSFDDDGSGTISHQEFIQGIRKCPEPPPDTGGGAGTHKRCGPLERPPLMEPKRLGFEAYPVHLALGNSLHVGVAYRTTLTIHNVGDTCQRLTVKLRGDTVKNPVRIVKRPSGPLAPGMRAKAVFEILARRPGDVNCDVVVACGYNQLEVPLSAHFERRTTTSVPLSSTSFADDDVATVRTYRELSGKLPSFVERLGTVASASCVPVADSKDVWPTRPEHWERIQRRSAEASELLTSMGPLRKCPQLDMNNLCLRMRRFRAEVDENLTVQGEMNTQILFIASGVADVFIDTTNVLTIRAPFYVGEGAILEKQTPTATVTCTSVCEGFALQSTEADVLLARNNTALNLMHQEMKKRKYERYCADEGGLLHCNYDDANFVDALLDYVNTLPETKELLQVKTKYACEHLNFAKRCRDGGDFGDLLSECDRLWFEYIREKGLSERQLEETKGIFHSPRKVKGSTKLGIHLVTDDRVRTMLALRTKAKEQASATMLVEVYADLANEVIAQIRTVMEDFVSTKQYKRWLTERFPLPEDPEPEEDPGRSARDPASLERKSSWRFELPDLQDLNEPPVDNRSVVTAGSSTWGSRPGFRYIPKDQRPKSRQLESDEGSYASSSSED